MRGWSGSCPLPVILALAAILVLSGGCARPPDGAGAAGGTSALAADSRIADDYGGVYADDKLAAWLTDLGQRLAAKTGRPDLRFTFAILDSPAVNAFSTREGSIFVTRGLLALGNSDAEIAGVLGHEIGHVVAGDRARRTAPSRGDGFLNLLAGLADWSGFRRGLADQAAQFSQDQEYEADAYAIRIVAEAGYDPRALAAFLGALDRAAAIDTALSGAFGDRHPLTADRLARVQRLADRYPPVRRGGHDGYFRAVDGMIYGDSPQQGYVRGRAFIHPRAGFLFEIPPGFSIRNAPSALVGSRADGAAFILTSGVPGAAATPYDYLTDVWMAGRGVSAAAPVDVNGHPAAIATVRLPGWAGDAGADDAGAGEARIAAVGWSPSLVYRWISVGPTGKPSDAASVLSAILDGFRSVTPQDLARLRPYRLRVLTAKSGDTVASLARRMAAPDDRAASYEVAEGPERRLRALNGWPPDIRIRPGQPYKVVE
jgi:predicted Zn-dependent protease